MDVSCGIKNLWKDTGEGMEGLQVNPAQLMA